MARQAQARTGLSAAGQSRHPAGGSRLPAADPAMVALIEELHGAGHALYALSNMGHASIDWLERQDFWRFFSGKVVSARVRMMKPEPDIYRYLLVSFDLQAEECLFIDDSQANVAAAEALGLRGWSSPMRPVPPAPGGAGPVARLRGWRTQDGWRRKRVKRCHRANNVQI